MIRWLSRCCFAAILGFSAAPALAAEPMHAHFIDVGQGAATLLEFPCGAMLIDAGGDADNRLIRYLEDFFLRRPDLGRTIDLLIITHPHVDHTRFLPAVADNYRIRAFAHNGQLSGSGAREVRATVELLTAARVPIIVPAEAALGDSGLTINALDNISCSEANPVIRFLSTAHPAKPEGWQDLDYEDENNHSLAVRVDYGESSLLFPGDLEDSGLEWLLARWSNSCRARQSDSCLLNADVLQVSKHGASNGTTPEFLEAVSPRTAVISVGRWDADGAFSARAFGMPRLSTVELLSRFVTGFRTESMTAMVARSMRSFEAHTVAKAVYATAWDGDVVITTSQSRDYASAVGRGPEIALGAVPPPPVVDTSHVELQMAAIWPAGVKGGAEFELIIAFGPALEVEQWKQKERRRGFELDEGPLRALKAGILQVKIDGANMQFREHSANPREIRPDRLSLLTWFITVSPSVSETDIDVRASAKDSSARNLGRRTLLKVTVRPDIPTNEWSVTAWVVAAGLLASLGSALSWLWLSRIRRRQRMLPRPADRENRLKQDAGIETSAATSPRKEPEMPSERKTETSLSFDVFLSHNGKDKPSVRRLKKRLSERGLRVWLDEDELQPGIPWQRLLEQGIRGSRSVVVLLGKDGRGPWENEEMDAALRLAVNDKRTVIPVLLPQAPDDVEVPLFLGNRTWVDLRPRMTKRKLDRLVWGITDQKQEPR